MLLQKLWARQRRRLLKWSITVNRYRNIKLWGAAGLVHDLFDAPRPAIKKTSVSMDVDRVLVARLLEKYRALTQDFGTEFTIWPDVAPLHRALTAGDADSLASQFGRLFQDNLLLGMGHAETLYFGERVWRPGFQELRMTDTLLALGEALGVLSLPSHAQMKLIDYVTAMHTDQNALFGKIEAVLAFSLEMPRVGNPPVFTLNGISTNADMVRHAYVANRIRQLGVGPQEAIVELGGGFGSLGLLANRAGFRNYTIIDLPVVGAIQTYFLGSALGRDAVSGYRENPAAMRVLPPPSFGEIPDRSVALSINMDSLPEIPRPEALAYLREIRRTSRQFLSINQEASAPHEVRLERQTIVSDMIEEVGGFERIYRFPYWIIEGYAEELYRVV